MKRLETYINHYEYDGLVGIEILDQNEVDSGAEMLQTYSIDGDHLQPNGELRHRIHRSHLNVHIFRVPQD